MAKKSKAIEMSPPAPTMMERMEMMAEDLMNMKVRQSSTFKKSVKKMVSGMKKMMAGKKEMM